MAWIIYAEKLEHHPLSFSQRWACPDANSTLSQGSQAGTALPSSASGPKVFTAPTRALTLQGHAHLLCSCTVLKKKQKFNVVMMCQYSQPQMLCETLDRITHPPGKLCSKWTAKENCPPRNTETAFPGIPSWDLRPENSRAASPAHRGSWASHLTHSPAQVAWEPTIFQTQLGLDLQVNSREAWELLQLRSRVPGSPDGSLEALITGTLSELLLPHRRPGQVSKVPGRHWAA